MGVFPATATPLLEQTAKGGYDKQRQAKRQLALPMRQLPLPAAVEKPSPTDPSDFAFAFIRGAFFKLGCKRPQESASAAMPLCSASMRGLRANLARNVRLGGIWRNACTRSRRLITRRSRVQIPPPLPRKAPETGPFIVSGLTPVLTVPARDWLLAAAAAQAAANGCRQPPARRRPASCRCAASGSEACRTRPQNRSRAAP